MTVWCTCGHSADDHDMTLPFLPCTVDGCPCPDFDLSDFEEDDE